MLNIPAMLMSSKGTNQRIGNAISRCAEIVKLTPHSFGKTNRAMTPTAASVSAVTISFQPVPISHTPSA